MQAAPLTYRLFEDSDLPGILTLWKNFSGWGGITEQQFYDWHINTPAGPCSIIVAQTQEGEIIGQMVFRPTKMLLRGEEVNGSRVMAPILNDNFRESDIKNYDHPTYAMFRLGISYAASKNIDIIFFSPSIGWVPVVKTFPKYGLPDPEISIIDCIGIDVKKIFSSVIPETNLFEVQQGKISSAYESLWNKFVKSYPVENAISRSTNWLKWRRSDDLILEAYHPETEELKGVVIIKKKTGQIVEIIAESMENLQQTLKAVSRWLYQNLNEINISEIKLMHTPFAEQLVLGMPHHTVNFRFAFVCLSPQRKEVPLIREWFIMPDE